MAEEDKKQNGGTKDLQVENANGPQLRYPRSIAFIIGNEFCERFSYYGAKAILVLFFKNVLSYSENESTEYYHIFAMACYFTPVLGAIIADSLLGKFRTILYISVLYAIGNIILSYASYLGNHAVTWIGLAAIALGTGGIKPCVSAFGGDQFSPGQEKQLQKFFSLFYISINAGSLLSTFITPILREDVPCFGREDCFPLAFGVPAALMVVALLLFILGKFITGYIIVPPKKGNIVVDVVVCVFTSLSRKLFKKGPKRDHWLDYADDKYDAQTISDIKAVMRILFLYLPLPIFWALFDQQGSRWTLQATKMDGNLFGVYRLKPDQIQVINPLLIILFIPIFEYGVYPLLAKCNLLKKPLQRIVTGGVLAAIAFMICGFFQLEIESELPIDLNSNSIHLTVINGLPNSILIENSSLNALKDRNIESNNLWTQENVKLNDLENFIIDIKLYNQSGSCPPGTYRASLTEQLNDKTTALFITESICKTEHLIHSLNISNILEKPADGGAYVGLALDTKLNLSDFTLVFQNDKFTKSYPPVPANTGTDDLGIGFMAYEELDVHIGGDYKITLEQNNGSTYQIGKYQLKQGGSYVIIVNQAQDGNLIGTSVQVVKHNSLPMLWQIVQYSVITAGEIMFSITGLEFSYSQAPKSMKSVLQAAWLLTVAFGNVIVVIIAAARISKQSTEFFFFGGLMIADMIVFAIMAYFYVPNQPQTANESSDNDSNDNKTQLNGKHNNEQPNEKNGVRNEGFNEEDTKF